MMMNHDARSLKKSGEIMAPSRQPAAAALDGSTAPPGN
jgi:hypothetical protein